MIQSLNLYKQPLVRALDCGGELTYSFFYQGSSSNWAERRFNLDPSNLIWVMPA